MDVENLKARFFSHLRRAQTGCIEWVGANVKGYGRIGVRVAPGRGGRKMLTVTHVSWFIKHGVWPTKSILHRCDNPRCVKPDHLFEGTDADNAADRDAKGRHRALAGDAHGSTKITDADVCAMRAEAAAGSTYAEIAARRGLARGYVYGVVTGRFRATAGVPPTQAPRKARRQRDIREPRELSDLTRMSREHGICRQTLKYRWDQGLRGEELLRKKVYTRRK